MHRLATLLVASTCALSACSDSTATVTPALEIVQGAAPTAAAGATLAESLAVRAVGPEGGVLRGVPVSWSVTPGGGSVSPAATATGADGIARTQWTIGSGMGQQTVTASAPRANTVSLSTIVGPAPPPEPPPGSRVHDPVVLPTGHHVIGMSGAHATELFAVTGRGLVYYLDGTQWRQKSQSLAPVVLQSIWGTSSSEIFALAVTDSIADFVFRFDGSEWHELARIQRTEPFKPYHFIFGSSATDLWLAGWRVMHYDGSSWTSVTVPTPISFIFTGWSGGSGEHFLVRASGTLAYDGSVWNTVSHQTTDVMLRLWNGGSTLWAGSDAGAIYRYDGSAWELAGRLGVQPMRAIWGSAAGDLWAVGNDEFQYWDRTEWRPVTLSIPVHTIEAVWGDGNGRVWAIVGGLALYKLDGLF
jgi:hypothetical protein